MGKSVFKTGLVASTGLHLRDRGTQHAQYRADLFGALVLATRPEKSLQPVAFGAWNDVHMEVGNALTDAIVGSDEGAFGAHTQFDCR